MRKLLVCVLMVAACTAAVPSASSALTASPLPVLGFQAAGDPLGAIDRSAAALGSVGIDGVDVTESGTAVDVPDSMLTATLARAHHDGRRAVLLIGNWSNVINDFSEPVAYRMLASAANRSRVEHLLAHVVLAQGWDGINVDLESLGPRDTGGLVAFLRELRAVLPSRATLSIDLSNETSLGAMQGDGYNLAAIGRAVNTVVLMAYDENGPWNPTTPGPIGELTWQRAGLRVLLSQIPAAKVVLGVAGYGYAWRPTGAVSVSDAQARALCAQFRATPQWVATKGEWTARLTDGSVLWWSDARSFQLRRTLAGQFHLSGLAVWDLGLSDPIR